MIARTALAFALCLLAACAPEEPSFLTQPGPSTPPAAKPTTPTLAVGDNAFCEAKDNSGKPCDTIPDPEPQARPQPTETAASTRYQPWQCETGATAMGPVLGAVLTGTLDDLQAYCDSIGMGEEPQQSYQPAASTAVGGGCVWKGRSYAPGDSIRAASDGTIYAGDLFVNGQRFDVISNVGRGPNERFQGCDCGSSSGKWGCV